MTVAKLIEILRHYNLFDKIYIQAGFNRFNINDITLSEDGGIIIITSEEANNPQPIPSNKWRA